MIPHVGYSYGTTIGKSLEKSWINVPKRSTVKFGVGIASFSWGKSLEFQEVFQGFSNAFPMWNATGKL